MKQEQQQIFFIIDGSVGLDKIERLGDELVPGCGEDVAREVKKSKAANASDVIVRVVCCVKGVTEGGSYWSAVTLVNPDPDSPLGVSDKMDAIATAFAECATHMHEHLPNAVLCKTAITLPLGDDEWRQTAIMAFNAMGVPSDIVAAERATEH